MKKSLSPVIATVLLVAMVIVIGLIVFLWMRGSVKEVIYKFGDKNVELACGEVIFDVEYQANEILYVVNNGDVAIKNFKVQKIKSGTKETFDLAEVDNEFTGISSGNGKETDVSGQNIGEFQEILVIPVLQGKTNEGVTKDYVCDEKYGVKRTIV